MITVCVCSVNHKLSELSCPTHWFLQLTTSSLSYLSSQWKHFLFLFVALLVTANRSQCELRAASTKLHWRIDIWSDIKSSKIPSIQIGLRHSAWSEGETCRKNSKKKHCGRKPEHPEEIHEEELLQDRGFKPTTFLLWGDCATPVLAEKHNNWWCHCDMSVFYIQFMS